MQVLLWFLRHLIIGGYIVGAIMLCWQYVTNEKFEGETHPADTTAGCISIAIIISHTLITMVAWKSVIIFLTIYGLYKKCPEILSLIKQKIKRTAE